MKKSLVAAVLTIGFIGNAFASCDSTPYVSPDELQPACAEKSPTVQGQEASLADKLKEKREIDSNSESNADATEIHASEKSSQSGVK